MTRQNIPTSICDRLTIFLRSAASLSLPIVFCLFVIDKTQGSDFYTNSDALYFPRLIEDLIQRPWGLNSWILQPVPDYIPSIPIYLFSYFLTGDFRPTIVLSAIVQTSLFFGICVLLYRRYRSGGQPLVWIISFVALLVALINVDRVALGVSYPAPLYGWILQIFLLNSHFGSLMGALLGLYFTDLVLREDSKPAVVGIIICSILFGISDYFFLLIFTTPMTVVVLWLWLISNVRNRCIVSLAAIAIGGAAALLLGRLVTPALPGHMTLFDSSRMRDSWRALMAVFWDGGPEPLSLLILCSNLALAAYAVVLVGRTFWRPYSRPIGGISFLDILVLNSVDACVAVSIAVVVTGMFINVWTLRYFNCVIFIPAIITASLMAARVEDLLARWGATRREAALNVVAVLAIVSSTVLVAGIRIDLRAPNEAILKCLKQEHAVAGMADYWNASPLILFSRWKYHVVQVTNDGSPYYALNNRAWVNHDWFDPAKTPRYSFIVMQNLSADRIMDAYGRPERVVACGSTEIWFYTNTEELTSRLLRRR